MSHLAWTIARRDLRGGWKSFRLALVGLALGVATIAGVGSFGAGLVDGLRDNGRGILGGDIARQTTMIGHTYRLIFHQRPKIEPSTQHRLKGTICLRRYRRRVRDKREELLVVAGHSLGH